MEENSLRTSVVIEVADDESPEEQKMFEIDLNDKESPKNFVIDEIFCGDNITVYALFEISDVSSVKSSKKLIEVTNSITNNEDYNFFHRNSYKNGENGRTENGCTKENIRSENVTNKKNIKSESLYCLGHFEEGYSTEASEKTEDSNGLKVLYKKDNHKKTNKSKELKSVSRGINTEIAQSPRLLEEVQHAVEVKLPFVKNDQKISVGCFDEIIEIETRISSSKFNSETTCKNSKKPSTHFLIVPLVMMDETMVNQLKTNDKSLKLKDVDVTDLTEKISQSLPEKISLGINTDTPLSFPEEKKIQIKEEITQTLSQSLSNIAEDIQTHQQSNKESILEEVKTLHLKLNSLIESLEAYKIITKSQNKNFDSKSSEKVIKENEEIESVEPDFVEEAQVVFESLPPSNASSAKNIAITNKTKQPSQELKTEIAVVKSKSSTVISLRSFSSVSQNVIADVDPKPVKKTSSDTFINWISLENWRGLGTSKSESVNRSLNSDLKTPSPHVKKSFSFDMKSEKPDALSLKKIKNLCCKLEPNNTPKKPETRIIQEISTLLGDNIILPKNEMGDEMIKNQKNSKSDILDLIKKKEKNTEVLGTVKHDEYKNKECHKEEGDAKLASNLINPSYIQKNEKLIVQYCTSTTKSENVLKNTKIPPQKSKIKNFEKIPKLSSDSANSKNTNKKIGPDNKKETKALSKPLVKAKAGEKGTKSDKNESNEILKPKFALKSKKLAFNNVSEPKPHVNKLIKKSEDEKSDAGSRSNTETKNGSKGDATRLPRLLSQKRERRDTNSGDSRTSSRNDIVSRKNSQNKLKIYEEKSKRKKKGTEKVEEHTLESNDSNEENSIPLASPNPSSVIVELFLKKPTSVDDFYSEADQECLFGSGALAELAPVTTKSKELSRTVSQSSEKPIVKSVWALTKVLLFEDGTKKLEILEASLTPPGCYFK